MVNGFTWRIREDSSNPSFLTYIALFYGETGGENEARPGPPFYMFVNKEMDIIPRE